MLLRGFLRVSGANRAGSGPAFATTRAPAPGGALQPGPTGYDAYPSVAEEKSLGHYCWVCGRTRANERFSGRGHARHICRDCQRLPREERDRVRSLLEIEGFLEQQNISAKNVARLKTLARSPDEEVRRKAGLVLEVGHLAPGKRKRHSTLAKTQPHPQSPPRM